MPMEGALLEKPGRKSDAKAEAEQKRNQFKQNLERFQQMDAWIQERAAAGAPDEELEDLRQKMYAFEEQEVAPLLKPLVDLVLRDEDIYDDLLLARSQGLGRETLDVAERVARNIGMQDQEEWIASTIDSNPDLRSMIESRVEGLVNERAAEKYNE